MKRYHNLASLRCVSGKEENYPLPPKKVCQDRHSWKFNILGRRKTLEKFELRTGSM